MWRVFLSPPSIVGCLVKYTKAPLTFDQQADLLISRGLLADRAILVDRLREVNYYRLSAYWHPFRKQGADDLELDTRFDLVWRDPVDVFAAQHRLFAAITLLRYMMAIIAPQSQWPDRFVNLLSAYPDIPLLQMGFPENWRTCPIWPQSPKKGTP